MIMLKGKNGNERASLAAAAASANWRTDSSLADQKSHCYHSHYQDCQSQLK